jgi:heme/copper-type cytochrome/quinol oxidase subunit 4
MLMQNMIGFKLDVAVKWVALWTCFWENLGSDVNLKIIYPDRFLWFS